MLKKNRKAKEIMLDILNAIIFGVVEGITEWLPVSSTGHLILLQQFIGMNVTEEFWSMFEVVIQLGAILAVVVLFWNELWPFSKKEKYFIKQDTFVMWFKIAAACIPAAVVQLAWGDKIEELFYHYWVIAFALIIFGVGFIIIEKRNEALRPKINTIGEITYMSALIIGMFQLIAAIFPGTSRSGATILGAVLIGVSRKAAAEFTFFLAIPVMFGASLIKVLKFGFTFTQTEAVILLTGMLAAFIVSILVIRFLMDYIKKHDFKVFGWYRIVLGSIVLVYFSII